MTDPHAIPMSLRAAYRLMHRQTNAWLAELGVTADQFVLLALLDTNDGVTQQQLVERASSDPNTVRAMLVLLEKRGLVQRVPHPKDGRARLVTLTTKGRRKNERIAARISPLQHRLSGLFSEAEATTLIEFLKRIALAMQDADENYDPAAAPALGLWKGRSAEGHFEGRGK